MKRIAFMGGLLIDGTGEVVENSLVIVEEKKIRYAGPMIDTEIDCEIIDITGKNIIPGLIDTHLHFSGNLEKLLGKEFEKTQML